MVIEFIVLLVVGLLSIYLGFLIWKKERISLIHSYHYTKVKEQDKKAYTQLMGKGLSLIGVGIILTAIIDYVTKTAYGWFVFGIFFAMGFVIITTAQKRYNGGFF